MLKTAGSADKAIASLQIAKSKNALGDFGLDPRQLSGVIAQIKQLDKEMRGAADGADDLAASLNAAGKRANALGDLTESFQAFARGDFLKGIEKIKKGLADLSETKGLGGAAVKAALVLTIVNMVAQATEKVTARAVELQAAFNRGEVSAGGVAEELVKSVPILSSLYNTMFNIAELFDIAGIRTAKEQIKAQEKVIAAMERQLEIATKIREQNEQWAAKTTEAATNIQVQNKEMAGLKNQAAEMRILAKFQKDLADARKQADKDARDAGGGAEAVKNAEANFEAYKKVLEQQRDLDLKKLLGGKTAQQKDLEEIGKGWIKSIQDGMKSSGFADIVKKLKEESERYRKEAEGKAQKIREGLKTEAEKLGDELGEAVRLKREGFLSQGSLEQFFQSKADKVQDEIKKLSVQPRRVFDLPDIKEVRSGQTLFAPPTKIDEEQLKKLEEANQILRDIRDRAENAGIVIEEMN